MSANFDSSNLSALNFNKEISKEVEKISIPLFENFGVTNFGYAKIFNDGKMFRLSTDEHWTQKYFEHSFYNDIDFYQLQRFPVDSTHINLIYNVPKTNHFKALYEFNIWNILIIYQKFKSYCNVWFFATSKENDKILNFYMNHIDILKHFTFYFQDQFSHMIKSPPKNSLITTNLPFFNQAVINEENIQRFLTKTEVKKYYLGETLHLTKRELECLSYLSSGKTMKEIATITNLSPRTIEYYINILKKKTGCTIKSKLVNHIGGNSSLSSIPLFASRH